MRGFGRAAAGALIALMLVAGSGMAATAAPVSRSVAVQRASLPKIPSMAAPSLKASRAGIGDSVQVRSMVFKPKGVTYTYQWYRDGKRIAGGTTSRHKLVAADKGRRIYAVVTGHKRGYANTALKSHTLVPDFRYRISGKPSIWVTDPIVGTEYTADTADIKPLQPASVRPDKLTFQWKLNGKSVKGATKSTYKVAAADYGKKLSVTVTAHARGYSTATTTSAQTGTVKKGYVTSKKPLYVAGDTEVGSTLGVTDGQWLTGSKLSYQWYYRVNGKVGWKPVSGATKSTFKIGSKYAGKRIYVQVTGSKTGYINSYAKSAWSGTIAG